MLKPNFDNSLQNNPFLSFESIEISEYILDEILTLGSRKLYFKYLNEKMPDHNGQYMVDINRGVLQIENLSKDEGENQFTYLNKWNEEEEPIAPKIDSWGTSTIRREMKPPPNISMYGGKTEDDAKSSKSLSTTKSYTLRSVKSKITTALKMKNMMGDLNSGKKKTIIEMPKIEKLPEEAPIQKDENYYKDERLRTEREVKAKEKNDEATKKAKKQLEDDEIKEKVKLLNNKLKNKEYTYDFDGSIIFVKPLFKPETLPAEIPILDHNCKAPPEVLKQPYENLGIKIKETEETVARASFTKEEILKQMQQKSREQKKAAAVQKKKPVVSKKKLQQIDDDDMPVEGIELPRQTPLVEIMEAKTGVNIVFDNGFLKEGKIFAKDGRMKKEEFEKVLEERKKMLEDQRKITRLDEKSQGDKNDEFKKQVEKIKELKSTTEKNLELMNQLGIKNKKNVYIHEEAEYVKMMATNLLGPQIDMHQLEQKINTKSMISQTKKNPSETNEKVKIERITLYKKVGDLIDGQQIHKKPTTASKSTKLHQIVEDFNENEVINNPKWGSAVYESNQILKEKGMTLVKKINSSPQKERGIKLRERGKLTAGNFFPRIASPNLNKIIKMNKKI